MSKDGLRDGGASPSHHPISALTPELTQKVFLYSTNHKGEEEILATG